MGIGLPSPLHIKVSPSHCSNCTLQVKVVPPYITMLKQEPRILLENEDIMYVKWYELKFQNIRMIYFNAWYIHDTAIAYWQLCTRQLLGLELELLNACRNIRELSGTQLPRLIIFIVLIYHGWRKYRLVL